MRELSFSVVVCVCACECIGVCSAVHACEIRMLHCVRMDVPNAYIVPRLWACV